MENKGAIMRHRKIRLIRNTLNLADATQVRLIKKRFRISEAELAEIVGKIGNSIAAIGKEVAVQRARQLPEPKAPVPAAWEAVQVPELRGIAANDSYKPEQ